MARWFVCAAILTITVQVHGSVHDYDLKHWTSQDGLSSQAVRALVQDKNGYLWVGTLSGLNRFDGKKFTIFNTRNQKNLASNAINRLYLDSSGRIWIGTRSGLSLLNPETLTFEKVNIFGEVTDVIEMSPGRFLVAANGLFSVQDKKITRLTSVTTPVSQLEKTEDGIWAASSTELFFIKQDNKTPEVKKYPLFEDAFRTVVNDLYWNNKEQTLYIATESGLYEFTREKGNQESGDIPGERRAVYRIHKDRSGALWVSSDGILAYRNPLNEWENINDEHLDHKPWFLDILEAKDGAIWLASSGEGLYRAEEGNVARIMPQDVLEKKSVVLQQMRKASFGWLLDISWVS